MGKIEDEMKWRQTKKYTRAYSGR